MILLDERMGMKYKLNPMKQEMDNGIISYNYIQHGDLWSYVTIDGVTYIQMIGICLIWIRRYMSGKGEWVGGYLVNDLQEKKLWMMIQMTMMMMIMVMITKAKMKGL